MYQHNLFPEDDYLEEQFTSGYKNILLDVDNQEYVKNNSEKRHNTPHGNRGRHNTPYENRDRHNTPPHGGGWDNKGKEKEMMPKSPPPNFTPNEPNKLFSIDSGAIRNCIYNYVYIWRKNSKPFWMFPTFIGRNSISGYRWTNFGWVYTGFDLSLIESFYCVKN